MPLITHDLAIIAEFGTGDLSVGLLRITGEPSPCGLVIAQVEPGEVGRFVGPEGATRGGWGPSIPVGEEPGVFLSFRSLASLDVVIEELQELRARMEAG